MELSDVIDELQCALVKLKAVHAAVNENAGPADEATRQERLRKAVALIVAATQATDMALDLMGYRRGREEA